MLYEIIDENRNGMYEKVVLQNKNNYIKEEFQDFVRRAKRYINEFIEGEGSYGEKMEDIVDIYENCSSLQGVVAYLCEYNGFNMYIPPKCVSIHFDD